jgi:hypothetical protein
VYRITDPKASITSAIRASSSPLESVKFAKAFYPKKIKQAKGIMKTWLNPVI